MLKPTKKHAKLPSIHLRELTLPPSVTFPCDHWMSILCCQELLQRTSSTKLLAGFSPNLAEIILIWPSLIIIMVMVSNGEYTYGSSLLHIQVTQAKINFRDEIFLVSETTSTWGHMFHIGLYSEKHELIFLSEIIRPRALIFGMKHHLVDLYHVCSNYYLGQKMAPPQGLYVYNRLI